MMLLKQQNWEQWQRAGISSGNWGVCQEACSPAGGLSAPTPHLSSKHTQLVPPLLQCAPARSCRIFSYPWASQALRPSFPQEPHSRIHWQASLAKAPEEGRLGRPSEAPILELWFQGISVCHQGNLGSGITLLCLHAGAPLRLLAAT